MKKRVALFLAVITVGAFIMSQGCAGRCKDCGTVVKVTVLEGVNFAFDKADLLPHAYPILNEDVKLMKSNPSLKVRVEGHCDIRGTDEYNQKLSERRAKSVYNYFASQGIDKARMSTIGYGRSKPLVPNTSEANMYKNRRVEIKIIDR